MNIATFFSDWSNVLAVAISAIIVIFLATLLWMNRTRRTKSQVVINGTEVELEIMDGETFKGHGALVKEIKERKKNVGGWS